MKDFLVVDDDQIAVMLAEKTIEIMGVGGEIHRASNGQAALKLIDQMVIHSRSLPEIILLDLNMPVLNGFRFIEAFNSLDFPGKDTMRIVVVSSSEDPLDISRVKNSGIDFYLTKPIVPDELLKAIS
ncbi:MAG TPA: response regulator [Saprospiraceae bacterium]